MVALIHTSYAIRRILNYNENKVKTGIAECIGERNYLIDVDKLTFTSKLNRFLNQLQLNPDVIRNSVHISLNFVPSEAALRKRTLVQVAERYMQKIGFGDQPYLIYQHLDAGHPHLHLVSINVRADGTRINMFHLGRTHSVKACREIEKEFGLVVAEARKRTHTHPFEPIAMSKIDYGKHPFTQSLVQILRGVLGNYHYTTLTELNAVLRQYNVLADQGVEGSKMFRKRGLVYRILNANGKPIGAYVRASDLPIKATLKFLDQRFKENEAMRLPFKSRIQNLINKSLIGKIISLDRLTADLSNQGIHVSNQRNEVGLIQSIIYVDHQTKCVFSGRDLGKQYNAEALQERCLSQQYSTPEVSYSAQKENVSLPKSTGEGTLNCANGSTPDFMRSRTESMLNVLLQNEHAPEGIPLQFKKTRRRKKRKNLETHP